MSCLCKEDLVHYWMHFAFSSANSESVPQRWIDQSSSGFSLRLNWPHWSGVIFPAGWARSVPHRALSKGTSGRSEAVAALTAAAPAASKPHIARRAKCHVSGLACGYAMGAAAYLAIWTHKQVFLAGKVSAHPSHLWVMMNGPGKMAAGVNGNPGAHTGPRADGWSVRKHCNASWRRWLEWTFLRSFISNNTDCQ